MNYLRNLKTPFAVSFDITNIEVFKATLSKVKNFCSDILYVTGVTIITEQSESFFA